MKKTLALALSLSSLSVFATDTFLGSIKIEFKPISYAELKTTIKEHAQKKGFLSLGESHLQSETAIQVNADLMMTYLSETNKKTSVFCSETLSHFLNPYEVVIKENVSRYKIFEKNGPRLTDFSNCVDKRKFKNYVTYSGFFHQYPFGRPFGNEFPKTPVITAEGNNILAQMNKLEGVMVTQMELEYMEFSASKALLEMGITDVNEFKAKAQHLEGITTIISDNMESVIKTDNPYTSKNAVVIKASDFSVDLNGNDKSYFVMTNLAYRKTSDSLKALKALLKLDDISLSRFLNKLKNSTKRTVSVFLGPFPDGNLGTVSYPGVTRTFKGQSLIMHIRNSVEDYLMVMEPDAEEFVCVNYQTNEARDCF